MTADNAIKPVVVGLAGLYSPLLNFAAIRLYILTELCLHMLGKQLVMQWVFVVQAERARIA